MQNKIIQSQDTIYRILEEKEDAVLVIDCTHERMPDWVQKEEIGSMKPAELVMEERALNRKEKQVMHQRFSMICPILPYIGDKKKRSVQIQEVAKRYNVSVQTVRKYLMQYLTSQDMEALAPKERIYAERELTKDEKNIRWALNRYFYNMNKNSLKTTYRIMLKEKYCDSSGNLPAAYPSYYQFRYYYRKTKNMQNYYISRNGKSNYQRNDRPCTGEGVQEFAPYIGIGMLDATICDIYLINDSGELIGRPILTACVDANSSLCCGYMLSWEGGVYSLTGLLLNVLKNKKEHCSSFGILIEEEDWPCHELPAEFVTDMGAEYTSGTFEQVTELGVTLTNLPPYRPELKGPVEKFFDIIQDYYKPYLKGKGVVEKDFQERGVHDYRRDACLTLPEFERILLKCILFYNKERVCKKYPYTTEMIEGGIQPTANAIWNWEKEHERGNLISVSDTELVKCLLPRTDGIFKRTGLHVNGIRYVHPDYTEQYLTGGRGIVAFNPNDISTVWLLDKADFVPFSLIETALQDSTLEDAKELKKKRKSFIAAKQEEELQAEIDLMQYIQSVAENCIVKSETVRKHTRTVRKKAQKAAHNDLVLEVGMYE